MLKERFGDHAASVAKNEFRDRINVYQKIHKEKRNKMEKDNRGDICNACYPGCECAMRPSKTDDD